MMCFLFLSYGMKTITLHDMALIRAFKDLLLDILEFDVLITNRLYQFVGVIYQDNFGSIMVSILYFFHFN